MNHHISNATLAEQVLGHLAAEVAKWLCPLVIGNMVEAAGTVQDEPASASSPITVSIQVSEQSLSCLRNNILRSWVRTQLNAEEPTWYLVTCKLSGDAPFCWAADRLLTGHAAAVAAQAEPPARQPQKGGRSRSRGPAPTGETTASRTPCTWPLQMNQCTIACDNAIQCHKSMAALSIGVYETFIVLSKTKSVL